VMTRNEHRKAHVAPPPASKAPYPTPRKVRSLSPKSLRSKTTKVPLSTQVTHQVAKGERGSKDSGHQPGSVTVHHLAPSPEPASTKTFTSVAATPKTPTVTKPQQASPAVQTPTKPLQGKTDAKKTSPNEGKQSPKKGKVCSKPKPVTMSQKTAETSEQTAIKAKQADKTDSPNMKNLLTR